MRKPLIRTLSNIWSRTESNHQPSDFADTSSEPTETKSNVINIIDALRDSLTHELKSRKAGCLDVLRKYCDEAAGESDIANKTVDACRSVGAFTIPEIVKNRCRHNQEQK